MMKKRLSHLTAFVAAGALALIAANSHAIYAQTQWQSITTENTSTGLPSDEVLDIKFDNNNILWTATGAGLASFDGSNWTIYGAEDGFTPSKAIQNLYIDSKQNLWVCTREEGLAKRSSDGKFTFYKYEEGKDGIADNLVQDITEDANGGYYIAASANFGNKISHLDKDGNWTYTNYDLLGSNPFLNVLSLAFDKTNNILYAGTDSNGLLFLKDGKWTKVEQTQTAGVSDIYVAKNGVVYAATDIGLLVISSPENYSFVTTNEGLANNFIRGIGEAADGTIWVSMADAGVAYKTDKGRWSIYNTASGLSSDDVYSIAFKKGSNSPYLGTHIGGLCYLDEKEGYWKHIGATGLANNEVKAILFHNDSTWFATSGGLSLKHGVLWKTFTMNNDFNEGFKSNFCRNMVLDPNRNALWVAVFEGGVARYNFEYDSWKYYTPLLAQQPGDGGPAPVDRIPSATDVYMDKKGDVWITTFASGIGKYIQEADTFQLMYDKTIPVLPKKVNSFFKIVEAPDGAIWFCSVSGVLKYKDDTFTFDQYPTKAAAKNPSTGEIEEFTDNNVRNVVFAKDGSAWICKLAGLIHLKDGKQTTYLGTPKYPFQNVTTVEFDDNGNLFVGTLLHGLYLLTPDGNVYPLFDNAGLPKDFQVFNLYIHDAKLYVTTDQGIFINDKYNELAKHVITGTEQIPSEQLFKAYPNPANNHLQFSEVANKFALYSLNGQLVMSGRDAKAINLDAVDNGTYILVVNTPEGITSQRVTVQH